MVNKERARAAVKTIRTSPTFKFNPSTRNPPRLSLGELPNGAGLTREEEESKRADQQALIQKMKRRRAGMTMPSRSATFPTRIGEEVGVCLNF